MPTNKPHSAARPVLTALFGVLLSTSAASGADMPKDADNFYTSDKVTLQKVTFKNQYDMNIAGNLFMPKDFDGKKKLPAIVVGHA